MRSLESRVEALRREMARGRGAGRLHPYPVALEPPFRPLHGQDAGASPDADPVRPPQLGFLRVAPSADDGYGVAIAEQLLVALGPECPVVFEAVSCGGPVGLQLAAREQSMSALAQQVLAHYRRAEVCPHTDLLGGAPLAVAHCYRLRDSHLFLLRSDHRAETYTALLGALSALRESQCGVFQVLLAPVRHDWPGDTLRVAMDPWDHSRSAFVDLPNLPRRAQEKVSRPLFAASVRIAATEENLVRRLEGAFLSQFASDENALEAREQPYPVTSILARTTHASGMLLNVTELACLVHLPNPKEMTSGALRTAALSTPAPDLARGSILVPLGVNRHRGQEVPVGITADWLTRHVAVIGATGSGKTNLLKRFMPVVEAGHGLAFLDPAGDAAEELLGLVPKHRVGDVIYFDPTDRDWPPALNMLEYSDERERAQLASDLVTGLSRLSNAWGPRIEWILRQAGNTLLASRGEKTLRDIPRLLCEARYRAQVLSTVEDPDLKGFWELIFPRLERQGAVDPILNKLSRFVDNPLVRNIISQPNRIDFHRVLREGKVLICNLSKGELTEEVSVLLGSFILSRLYIATLARAQVPPQQRGLFVVVVDEFQNYAGRGADTASIRSFFSEARKYRVALVAATQFPSQLEREVAAAILGNVGTLICLRTGIIDARMLQQELGEFGVQELLHLEVGQALVRMGGAGSAFNADIPEVGASQNSFREEIVRRSRERYCRPRHEVEQALRHGTSVATAGAEQASIALQADERLFLEQVAAHPEQTVTEVAAAVGFSGYKAARVRKALQERELAVEVETRLGQGGTLAKFVVPTFKGCQAMGVEPPHGRGGPVHRHFQRLVADWARRKGYEVRTEHPVTGGTVDVHLEGPEGTVAVELSVAFRPQRELDHLSKCLEVGYDRVVCLCLNGEAEEQMRLLASGAFGEEELGKVSFGPLQRFPEVL